MIASYTREAGLRNLERVFASVCRKVARKAAEGKTSRTLITAQGLEAYLGPALITPEEVLSHDQVGVVTGLAWTAAGGDVLYIEASLMKGRGALILTGQLGDVMKESAHAALSFARAHAAEYGIPETVFAESDLHIHVPEGAIPKDGPSAGITMATALVSALTNRPVRRDVAMTGEITLRGNVLAIGGLKEKVLAAHRAKVRTVVIPEANRRHLGEIPKALRKSMRFVMTGHVSEVLATALLPEPAPAEVAKNADSGARSREEGRPEARPRQRRRRPPRPGHHLELARPLFFLQGKAPAPPR